MAAVLCCVLALPLASCQDPADSSPPEDTRSLSLGVSRESLSGLAYVARNEELFEQAGLDVEFVEFTSSQLALEALLAGEVDAALSADTPIVMAAINREPLRLIATVGTDSNDLKIVARSDAGIAAPVDLRGKRVGTREGTAAHFFLHVFLGKYGMADADVDMRFDAFENVTASLIAGDIDAVAVREPFVSQLRGALDSRFVLFEADGLYGKTMNLCVLEGEGALDPVTQQRLVEAFLAAEQIAVADTTGRMQQEVTEALGISPGELCECLFAEGSVGLRQSLVLGLEDQVRWAMQSELATAPAPPDVLAILDSDPLDEVAPDRVTVIR